MNQSLQMPPQASTIASQVDGLYYFIFWGSVFFFTLIVGLSTLFVIRYRRREGDRLKPGAYHNTPLEITWSVIPLILVLVVFVWGFRDYMSLSVAPGQSINYYVTGKKWLWEIKHPNGMVAINEMTVPVNQPVKVILKSADVIHSFFIPAFRIKNDAIPNRYTTLWFEATLPGTYDIFCTEYCGTGHSNMLAKVNVLPEAEFDIFMQESGGRDSTTTTLAEWGAEVYKSKACITCHSLDGSKKTGPTFQGIFGRVESLADGSQITVDEEYIRRSILEPNAQVVAGYDGVMPTYAGTLTPDDIDGIIEFLKEQ